MIRALVDMRGLTAMAIAAVTGVWGVTTYPPGADNVFLQLIALREPVVFRALMHGTRHCGSAHRSWPRRLCCRWRPSWRIDGRPHPAIARSHRIRNQRRAQRRHSYLARRITTRRLGAPRSPRG